VTYKILVTSKNYEEGHWIDVTSCSQKEFLQEVERLFGKDDSDFFVEDAKEMIPFEFHHAGVRDQILTDRFWDWRGYSKEDQELLVKYMEITSEDSVTLEEAKKYFDSVGNRFDGLNLKEKRMMFHHINETGNVNCTLEEAKKYFSF
jgi:hypothetical protein